VFGAAPHQKKRVRRGAKQWSALGRNSGPERCKVLPGL